MGILPLNEDLKKIQALGDNPNSDNNMTAEDLKAVFDAAALIIQAYINGILVPAINANDSAVADKVNRSGDAMTGALDMSNNTLYGLVEPSADDHAANKGYVDKIIRGIVGFTGAHSDLTGRDAEGQHPISAIVGLTAALAKINVDAGSESLPIYFKDGVPKVCGAVNSAKQISEARNIQTDLESEKATLFNGTQDVKPGVTGVLPFSHGGTGKGTGAEALAALLASGDIILTSKHYGTTLPNTGAEGQLFFKVVE